MMSLELENRRPLSSEDKRLIEAYEHVALPADALPYSSAFTEMVRSLRHHGETRTERELMRRLLNLRKAGRLPRVGGRTTLPGRISHDDIELIERLVRESIGSLGSRDQLPYSEAFEALRERYNSEASRQLNPNEFWRLIARVSK
jgi:hypothetical protein